MRVDTRPRKRNAPRIAEKSAPGFLQWLRGRQCAWSGCGSCGGKIIAQHLDFAGDKGTATKVSDRYCLPCCVVHHQWQHDFGWNSFLSRQHATKEMALNAAGRLWAAWPGRIAWERKLNDG
jgi:hypothetical protein